MYVYIRKLEQKKKKSHQTTKEKWSCSIRERVNNRADDYHKTRLSEAQELRPAAWQPELLFLCLEGGRQREGRREPLNYYNEWIFFFKKRSTGEGTVKRNKRSK